MQRVYSRPLLFLVFINDLPTCVHLCKLLLFADDAKCYNLGNNCTISSLQEDLNSLYNWSLTNISFNYAKSVYLKFHSGGQSATDCSFLLHDQPISRSYSHRDLGIILSEDLSWSLHYKSIVSKALITLNLLRRVFGTSGSIRARKLLYLSLVRSKLTYCSPIWRPQQRQHVLLLESVQRRATKWILNDYVSDYKTRLSSLEILPLMMLYEFHDIVFFLKSLKFPTPAFDIMTFVTFSSNQTRSAGYRLTHTHSRNNMHRHFYFTRLSRLWNSLPSNLNLLNLSVPTAKSKLFNFCGITFSSHFRTRSHAPFTSVVPAVRVFCVKLLSIIYLFILFIGGLFHCRFALSM